MAYVLLGLGALGLVASVALISLPAAGILASLLCLALGYGSWRAGGPDS
jgi:hypothetical protein